MSHAYHIIVRHPYDKYSQAYEELALISHKFITYEHYGEGKRTHTHTFVSGISIKDDAISKRIKKALLLSNCEVGKADIRILTKIDKGPDKGKPVNENALTYFHKGMYPIKLNKGFTEDFINEKHASSYVPQSIVKEKGEKKQYKLIMENVHQKKLRENDLIKLIIDDFKVKPNGSDDDLLESIMKVIRETDTICGIYKMMDYFDTISNRIRPGRTIDMMRNILQKRSRL